MVRGDPKLRISGELLRTSKGTRFFQAIRIGGQCRP